MLFPTERYSDFGPTQAREKLIEPHRISVATEPLRQWMAETVSRSHAENARNGFSGHANLMSGIRDGSTANAYPNANKESGTITWVT
nr:ISNCY family transposase [arsenite-oxidising bacterium NT-25]